MSLNSTLSKVRELQLRPWEECVGIFEKLEMDEIEVAVILSNRNKKIRLAFPANESEADIVKKELKTCTSGTRITILRTDDASRPLVISSN